MSKIQFDKKQLPQVIVLGIMCAGLFGYFAFKMITPPPSEAAPQPAAPAASASASPASTTAAPAAATPVALASVIDTPPSPNMHDPFVPASFASAPPAPKLQTASAAPAPLPAAPPLPKLPAFPQIQPLPAPPSRQVAPWPKFSNVLSQAPTAPRDLGPEGWTVTGVLGSDSDPAGRIACLRNGDLHKFVKAGGSIDGDFQVISINRDSVVLGRDNHKYRLSLGQSVSPQHAPAPNTGGTQVAPLASPAQKLAPAIMLRGNSSTSA